MFGEMASSHNRGGCRKQHVIICALSLLSEFVIKKSGCKYTCRKIEGDDDACVIDMIEESESSSDANSYYWGSELFHGMQTNEAPVNCLIDRANQQVNRIIYLVTDQCCSDANRYEIPGDSPNLPKMTTETFFKGRVCSMMGWSEMEVAEKWDAASGYFIPIRYKMGSADRQLQEVVDYIEDDTVIDIDLTGGGRDSASLLILAAQMMQKKSSSIEIGYILYANNTPSEGERKSIILQNETFELTYLISAVEAFTEFGRADLLRKLFCDQWKSTTSEDLIALCDVMGQFTDALSLCRVDLVEQLVAVIHKGLSSLRVRNAFSKDGLSRSELLFTSLIPEIKRRFIPSVEDKSSFILKTIEWCLDHGMLQQALAIYKQRLAEGIVDAGYIVFREGVAEQDAEWLSDLCVNLRFRENGSIAIAKDSKYYNKLEIVDNTPNGALFEILTWHNYLNGVRNSVVHALSTNGKSAYRKARKSLSDEGLIEKPDFQKWIDYDLDPDNIKRNLREGLRLLQTRGIVKQYRGYYLELDYGDDVRIVVMGQLRTAKGSDVQEGDAFRFRLRRAKKSNNLVAVEDSFQYLG